MYKFLACLAFFCFIFSSSFAQSAGDSTQTTTEAASAPKVKSNREQTLFRNARLTGGFGGPIFTLGGPKGFSGYGSGGGGGLVFNHFFLGGFGIAEYFDGPKEGDLRPALAYGGLWMGYTYPTNKLLHLYTSLKLGAGGVGNAYYRHHDWDIEDDLGDFVLVVVPEAGLELNVTRWFRVCGNVGYRYLDGFEGWNSLSKTGLDGVQYGLTLRFGWF